MQYVSPLKTNTNNSNQVHFKTSSPLPPQQIYLHQWKMGLLLLTLRQHRHLPNLQTPRQKLPPDNCLTLRPIKMVHLKRHISPGTRPLLSPTRCDPTTEASRKLPGLWPRGRDLRTTGYASWKLWVMGWCRNLLCILLFICKRRALVDICYCVVVVL